MGEDSDGGDDESRPNPDDSVPKNVTLKQRTWDELEAKYPHALDHPELVRMAVHDALDSEKGTQESEE